VDHEQLFDSLDLDHDGFLSRDELFRAACRLGWHWHETPLYALLDFMTIHAPLSREAFAATMEQVNNDPRGFFGSVLERFPARTGPSPSPPDTPPTRKPISPSSSPGQHYAHPENRLLELLPEDAASAYSGAMKRLNAGKRELSVAEAALLIIDPQRSFTVGEWMWRLGPTGTAEVMPIVESFHVCADLLATLPRLPELMFTRCPFPPESYDWDNSLQGVIPADQHYFIKPGNSVLQPPGNGFRQWVEELMASGRKTLVMGGCTLNSCVRVSALETLAAFRELGLRVVADLSLCGARSSNYQGSPLFGGMSAVEAAMTEMAAAGVLLAEQVLWF